MKKYLLLLLPFIAILNSCQKINGVQIAGVATGASATYQPLTAGSTWTYRTDYGGSFGYPLADTSVITMSANTYTINGKLYNQAYETHMGFGIADTGYYYTNNHEYSTMTKLQASATSSYAIEMLYLKDNAAVGTTWSSSTSNSSLGIIQLTGKIVEKSISKTVAGKKFANVIHTNIGLTYGIQGSTYTVTYDMYIAQGVGVIHVDLNQPGYPTVPEDLIAYTIK
jgi:hypothetical protein